jgi:hypothetical protein
MLKMTDERGITGVAETRGTGVVEISMTNTITVMAVMRMQVTSNV